MDGEAPCGGAVEESCLSECPPPVEAEESCLSECAPLAEVFRICRICLDDAEDEQNPLISPCRCTGTMRYIHRSCLDQWRTSSFQPRALMECTTCGVAFRTEYRGPARRTRRSWWLQFAVDVLWYLGLRFSGLTVSVAVLGFWPGLLLAEGPIILHANPFASHFLVGLYSFFFLVGTFIVARVAFLHRLSFRIPGWNKWRPGRLDKVDIGMVLIVIGVLCCLFLLFRGIYQIAVQGREEVWKSIRGVNEKVRKQVVKDYVILNYEEDVGSPPEDKASAEAVQSCEGRPQEAQQQPPSRCAEGTSVEAATE